MIRGRIPMSISQMLRGYDLFRSLPPEEVETLSSFSSVRSFAQDEVVHKDQGAASRIFVLLSGEVQLRLAATSGEQGVVVVKVSKGEIFGIAPLLGEERYTATAKCLTPAEVLALEAKPLREVLKRNPAAGHAVMSAVARAYYTRYMELLGRS
jgi:CRP-like cAMP-binding protein